jgi:hypothetical protein
VATLVGDAELRGSLAREALQRVGDRSWAAVVDELVLKHYAAVVGGSVRAEAA